MSTIYTATGRRKTSVARVRMTEGTGTIAINRLNADNYLTRDTLVMVVRQPLEALGQVDQYDIKVNVHGGGKAGQAGAIRHGIARALNAANEENRAVLKAAGYLTRDARAVERKKPGQPGARKKFQFSKR